MLSVSSIHTGHSGRELSEIPSLTRRDLFLVGIMAGTNIHIQHFYKPCFGNKLTIGGGSEWNSFMHSDYLSIAVNLVDYWWASSAACQQQNPSQC